MPLRDGLAGPDAAGRWHWSGIDDESVAAEARWAVAAAVVTGAAATGVSLPAVVWFAGESVAERAYFDRHDGDRPWDDFMSLGELAVLVDRVRGTVFLNRDLDAQSMVEAARSVIPHFAGVGS